jgi:divinyl protochlorophyllide a 8-vinyl-reductase
VLEETLGHAASSAILAKAGIDALPDGTAMIPEQQAARLHQVLRTTAPDQAPQIAKKAGIRTAQYILRHRIPRPAQTVLRLLPGALAAKSLSKAISTHAWTFVGSGQFRAVSPWHFEIDNNPLIAGERGTSPLCHWNASVFQHLYQSLVDLRCVCVETRCGALGAGPCVFAISRKGRAQESHV